MSVLESGGREFDPHKEHSIYLGAKRYAPPNPSDRLHLYLSPMHRMR